MGRYFFTADQHFGHENIIRFCNRPFTDVEEMDQGIIRRHNEVVEPEDTVVHAGDFAFRNAKSPLNYLKELNGEHLFVLGNHDNWLRGEASHVLDLDVGKIHIVVCHYALRVWPRSHYGSWQLHGHSHGTLEPQERQWDVGVDNNDFYPVSFEWLREKFE